MPDLRLFLPKRLPMVLVAFAVLFVVGTWLPLTIFAKKTQVKQTKPRIHLFQDMDNQPKLKTQAASPIFTDGRAMRRPVAGTVARGELNPDARMHDGYTVIEEAGEFAPRFVTGFPDGLDVDSFFLARGQEKFDTFCYPCHGKAGAGNGPVNVRALTLQGGDTTLSYGTVWTTATNLHQMQDGQLQFGAELYPNGRLFNTITHGKGTMAGYGHAIPVEDRWAIVAYVRALQLSQNTGAAKVAMDRADAKNLQTASSLGTPSAAGLGETSE